MLGSSSHNNNNDQDSPPPPLPPPPPPSFLHRSTTVLHRHHHDTPPSLHLRQLLFTAAQLISRSDLAAAHRLLAFLSTNAAAYGDATHRLVHSFTSALSLRLLRHHHHPPSPPTTNDQLLQSSYLSLNQITPFIRFCHLTANQAILEAIDQSHHNNNNNNHHQQQQQQQQQQQIHILDFNIMHGVQWPPLMQAIAGRHRPPSLRLTATGTNLTALRRTGDRLSLFAHSLGLHFSFHPILLSTTTTTTTTTDHHIDHLLHHISTITTNPNETLAVNFILHLHQHLQNRDKLCLLLRTIKNMNPRVVTLAEQEANHNHPIFLQRFAESITYYTAVFESLEATLPPNSRERMEVEQVWFGREIGDIVAKEGDRRRERHERFRSWEVMMRSSGYRNIPLSGYALSQAKLLLRLHYPSEGYNLEVVNGDCFLLGWQNQPLFSVSSWH